MSTPCCDGCGEADQLGFARPCGDPDPAHWDGDRAAMVAGVTQELAMAKWFVDNRWTIIGASFAAGGLFFATVAYFANRR